MHRLWFATTTTTATTTSRVISPVRQALLASFSLPTAVCTYFLRTFEVTRLSTNYLLQIICGNLIESMFL